MILLDTNVVSEAMRLNPDQHVINWIDAQPLETLYLSSISVAELRAGVALLPPGKRRAALQGGLEREILPLFTGRVLSFDLPCTHQYAELLAKARKLGRALGTADALVAAVAGANAFSVATRDVLPFRGVGLNVINPWEG
ncbi:MAG: type II toxin-antitoxin system VapC family toxin [Betaproteobacteria bacterium]|nr:type II toxin-antitoxin system VapC family toxin [Betaproteobacteria bacterium]